MSVAPRLMTTEEFLALPDDGVERELILGELREKRGDAMTTRGGPHGLVTSYLAYRLVEWVRKQPRPRGRVYTGEARVRLGHDPATVVGADLIYISAEHAARTDLSATFVEGPPLLAVEIVSPSDTAEGLADKRRTYLDAGVALVWEVNPLSRTILAFRPDAPPVLFNDAQDLTAEPRLPGFRAPVSEVFAD